jgi:hypothetical protein
LFVRIIRGISHAEEEEQEEVSERERVVLHVGVPVLMISPAATVAPPGRGV